MTARHQAEIIVSEFFADVWPQFKATLKDRDIEEGAIVWGMVCNGIQRQIYAEAVKLQEKYNNGKESK